MKMGRFPSVVVLAVSLLLSLPGLARSGGPVPAQPPADALEGVWEGAGVQTNDSSWSIRVTIGDGKYLVEYPSLTCKGTLSLTEKTAGYLRAVETITSGKGNCIDGGVVVLVWRQPQEVDYLWYFPDGKMGAIGVLTRVR